MKQSQKFAKRIWLTDRLVCASLHTSENCGAIRECFIEAARLLLHIREANASFLLAIRPKVFYNVFDASVK